jgi:hypothetical protein
MLGRQSTDEVRLPYRDIAKDGVEFRQETVVGIDPVARRVQTDVGRQDADFLVVAMGADYDMAAMPGFEEDGYEYYSLAGAERLRDALSEFRGGRVLVSVLGQPFKCPPAPFEGPFLLHEQFTQRGIREAVEMATTFPMQRPVPVTGEVSRMFRDGLASRGIEEFPEHLVTSLDSNAHLARLATGDTLAYDLFVGIPVHRAPEPLAASGLAVRCRSTKATFGPHFPTCTPSATCAPGHGPSPRQGSSLRRPRGSSPTTSRRRSSVRTRRRHTRRRASATPSSAAGLSARSRSTSFVASPRRPTATIPHSSTPPRRPSSALRAVPGGSDLDPRPPCDVAAIASRSGRSLTRSAPR